MKDKLNQLLEGYREQGKKGDAKHLDWAITNEPETEIAVKEPSLDDGVIALALSLIGAYMLFTGMPGGVLFAGLFAVFIVAMVHQMQTAKQMREELEEVRQRDE